MADLDFGKAFKYPFNRWKGLFNILWLIIPIVGWFAIVGYQVRLVKEWIDGQFKELPKFNFMKNLKLGFFMFLKSLPFAIALSILGWVFKKLGSFGTAIFTLLTLFLVPMLVINFYREETMASLWDFSKVQPVFDNLGDYIVALLKQLVLGLVFAFLSIIFIGIPANAFTANIFLADFYRQHVK